LINKSNLIAGNYTYQIFATDNLGNSNQTEIRTIIIQNNTAPTITMNSPSNNTRLNEDTSILLNATIHDLNTDLNNLTIWIYGGFANGTYSLLNTSYNQTNGTELTYNWTISDAGTYNWTVIVNDERINSSVEHYIFDLINLNFTCEAGGPYQQGALVLVQGALSNETGAIASNLVNTSIYDSNNNLNTSQNLTTSSDGGFATTFSNLSVGSYTLNATTTYQGYNESCTDTFSVGGTASFILDKIATVFNISNSTINYNITLRVINKGQSDAESVTLTDPDSDSSPYDLSTVNANSSVLRSYIANFTKQDSITYQLLSIATVNGTDPYSGNEITANSTERL